MNTRNNLLKKAIDLEVGDIVDFRSAGIAGYCLRYHVVDSEPSRRKSDPAQVCIVCHAWDPECSLPMGHEGRHGCSFFIEAEKLIRVCINPPDKMRLSWTTNQFFLK